MNKYILNKLFSLGILASTLFGLTSCGDTEFNAQTYTSSSSLTSLTMTVENRTVNIKKSMDDKLMIEYYDSDKEYLNITENDSIIDISLGIDKQWYDFIGIQSDSQYRIINLYLPSTISSLQISTTNENINADNLTISNYIMLNTIYGDIELIDIYGSNKIELTTKNENINGTIVGSYDDYSIKCDIKKGNTNLPSKKENGEKILHVNCNNGDANIEMIPLELK